MQSDARYRKLDSRDHVEESLIPLRESRCGLSVGLNNLTVDTPQAQAYSSLVTVIDNLPDQEPE
jgi:hypothetical protein